MASMLTCPKCGNQAERGGFAAWQWVVSICFFPIGLLSLMAGRKPTVCPSCGFSWQNATAHVVVEQVETQRAVAKPNESSDVYGEITKLGELKEKGLITQEEFDKKKAALLG